MLTDEEIKQAYFETIKNHTNNFYDIKELEKAPAPVQLAVQKMLEYGKRDATIASESISDLSTSYRDLKGLPSDVLNLINPYCKMRF